VRKFLLILLGLLVIAVVGVVVVVMTLDLNAYKPEIEAELEAATGRDVTIAGDIKVAFIPTLAISIEDVTVAGAPGGSGDPFLMLPEVLAVVALAPLASLDVVVERFRLIEPVVVLETSADGPASWELSPATSDGSGSSAPPSIKIELVDIQDGKVVLRDGTTVRKFENVDLWIEALGPDGPFEAQGRFSHLGHAWTLDADVGRFTRPQLALNITMQSGSNLTAKLAGTIAQTNGVKGFSGQVEANVVNLGFLGQLVELPPMPDALRNAPLSLDTRASVSPEALRLSDLSLSLGESSATGEALVQMEETLTADLTLSVSMLDLDTLLAAAAMAEGESIDTPDEDAFGQPWPDDVMLNAALTIDAAIYRGSPVRQVNLDIALAEGVWILNQAKAQLPGGTSVAMSGSLAMEEDEPTFRGPVEVTSDNLRATLDWLDVPTESVPQDRLRRVDLFADVVVSPAVLALTGLDLSFDSSRLTGGFAARIEDVPTLTVDIVLDQLNLDAYIVPTEPVEEGGEVDLPFSLEPFAFYLSLINLDLKARIDTLTYNGVAVGGIQADGTLSDGRLVVRSLGAADIAGAALRFSGEVDPAAGSVALQMGAKADDAGGLLRLMGVELPIDPAELGAVELVGDINGDAGQAIVRQRLQTALGAASVDGTLIEPFGALAFDGRVGLQSTSYRTLAAAIGADLPEAADSEVALAADIVTDGNKAEFEAILDVLNVSLRGSGSVADIKEKPVFDLRMQADHTELAALLRDLGVDGGFPDLGPLSLSLIATGSTDLVDVTLAPSTLGPSTIHGTLGLYLSDEKPRIEARLNAGELALDPFLAASSGGTVGDVSEGGDAGQGNSDRWSREELDFGILEDVDAHIELVAERLLLQGLTFARPTLVADIADGKLRIERFDGGLFDGQVALTGEIVAGVPHQTSFDVALANADMALVLEHFAQSDAITGRLYLDFTAAGQGLSQRDILQTLVGDGTITLRNGTLWGFDLRRINDRLGSLDDELAIATMLAEASAGGQTAVTAADGTFVMTDGVVHSEDLRVLLDGGQADFVLDVDLPRWWIDLESQAQLTGHAGAPTIPIAVHGSLDDPTRVVDTRSLQNFLIQRAAETALRQLGEDELDGAAGVVLDLLSDSEPVVSEPEVSDPFVSDPKIEEATVSAPLVLVPEKPEAPEAPSATILDLLSGSDEDLASPAEEAEAAGISGSGGLLDLLGGSVPNEPDVQEAPAEPAANDNQGLDTESLLQDLLNGLAN
jgi:uncharacterized protein involved in outer membrane biogenesis